MTAFELFITYIELGDDGKNRPVVIFGVNEDIVEVYPLTTQFHNKSLRIASRYFEVVDWQEAGLKSSHILMLTISIH